MTFPFPFMNMASEDRDSFFSSVQMLLHGDGPDGSTVIVDSSLAARTLTKWTGTVEIDTDQSKFGGSSIRFAPGIIYNDGAGITFSADYTVEMWFRTTSAALGVLIDFRNADAHQLPNLWFSSGALVFSVGQSTAITGGSIQANTWHHVAVSRVSGGTRLFLDGVQIGSTYSSATSYGGLTNKPNIGANWQGNSGFVGWIDDLRITAGVGRYTSNFGVPTKPFPNK